MSRPVVAVLSSAEKWEDYREILPSALREAGLDCRLQFGPAAPAEVDYIVYAPFGEDVDFGRFPRARAVLSLWAGVETIVTNPTLTIPLCRMVDPTLTAGMVEYVAGHVLRHHLGLDAHLKGQDGVWRNRAVPPLARERTVGILGLGELGRACGQALAGLGFQVEGWSRGPRQVDGIVCHSGRDGLWTLLRRADIVVLLLPLTPDTENLVGAEEIGWMKPGAVIINPGRGGLVDDTALLAALDRGALGHATLDTFRTEPLPASHPFWTHPRVTVTPHIAAATRPETAARVVAANIRRCETGEPLLNVVDRSAGY